MARRMEMVDSHIETISSWIPKSELSPKRLDSIYYDPKLSEPEKRLLNDKENKWRRLKGVAKDIYNFGAYELTNFIEFVDPKQSGAIPFITITDINNLTVEYMTAPHINSKSHNLLSASQCQPYTMLLSMAGTIGSVGVIPEQAKSCNANQAIAKITFHNELFEPYYAAAYFSSSYGQAACSREAAGAVQKNLYLYNISELPIIWPDKLFRTAIGNKVRAAERLRVVAEERISSSKEELTNALGWPIELDSSQTVFRDSSDLNARIDPLPYLPRYQTVKSLVASKSSKTLGEMDTNAWNGCEIRTFVDDGIPYLVVGDLEGWRLRRPQDWVQIPKGSEIPPKAVPMLGDLLCVRTGPVGKMVAWRPEYGNAALSSHWIRLKGDVKKGFNASYITVLSQLDIWPILIESIRYGAVQPQISQEELLDLPIPFAGTKMAEEIGIAYEAAVSEITRADDLILQAVGAVEQLIDGTLDQNQCLTQGRQLAEEFGLEQP